jgi:putative hemolysin
MEILILVLLTLLNGVFSMSEIAVVSSRRYKLEKAVKKGVGGARTALELAETPGRFLSTVQIGITLISIIVGLYSGATLAEPLKIRMETVPVLQPYAQNLATAAVVLFTTYLSIVLGELFPKRLGLSFPESIAMVVAKPMYWLSRLTAPFVWLLTRSNDLLLRLFGIKASTDSIVTEEEIKSMISESAESGEIQEIEQDIVERVFALGDRKVNALMTHRSDLIWLDVNSPAATLRAAISAELHTAYPVCDGDLDNFLGIATIKDLFVKIDDPKFNLRDLILEPVYVPGSSSAYKLLDAFRKGGVHCGIALDEFGAIMGMITMDDLVDALVGDISSKDQDEYQMTREDDQTWVADGQYPFFEFLRELEIEDDAFSDAEFSTLTGFMIAELDSMPKKGDHFMWKNYHFEVIGMEGRRVDKVRIKKTGG